MSQSRNIWGRYAKVTVLRPSTRGMKARGVTLTRPTKGSGKPKGQFNRSGLSPATMPNSVR